MLMSETHVSPKCYVLWLWIFLLCLDFVHGVNVHSLFQVPKTWRISLRNLNKSHCFFVCLYFPRSGDHTILHGLLSFSFLCCVGGKLLREFCVGWGPTKDGGESRVDADLLLPWSQRNLLTKTNPIFMIPCNMWIPDLVRMVCVVHDCRTANFLCPEIVTQTFKNPKM